MISTATFRSKCGRRINAATANIDTNGRNGRKSRGEIRIQNPASVRKKIAVATAQKRRTFVVCRLRQAMRRATIISGTKSRRGVQTISGGRVTATNSLKRNAQSMKLLHASRDTKYQAMMDGTMMMPAAKDTRCTRASSRRIAYVTTAAPASVISSSIVFSETANAPPRSSPETKKAAADRRDSTSTATASIQSAFQRLSVRNSIDFKKNGGSTFRTSTDQMATRTSYSRRAMANAATLTMIQSTSIGARMK